ncbi:MAG: 23S rRNA pseudouridine(1911/1915/1917) synthase RluD [Chromatiales bacterium]|nr:23S rRNA pseudouridine(1911/1915/1917) synthase RluD [Chromatiales bacterium]
MSDKKLIATLSENYAGLRLDKALAELFTDYSRSFLQHCLVDGLIRVNGNTAEADTKVTGGEQVTFMLPQAEPSTAVGEALPLNIVYEDAHLIIVNKPANIVVHPAAGHRCGTLLNALLHHCPSLETLPRGGIVHRLDKDTSGLLVIAKTRASHFNLVSQLQHKEIERHYIALARGQFISSGKIDAPIGRHPTDRKRMAVRQSDGKTAITHYRIAHQYTTHTRLDITLETGRTHQIRVHLSHIHHPLFGDPLYGGRHYRIKGWQPSQLDRLSTFNRQALHAARLLLKHPHSGALCSYHAELPDDMQRLFALFDENEQHTPG